VTFGGVEALLIGWLGTQIPGVRFLTDLPTAIATQVPVVQVVAVGGPDDSNDAKLGKPTISVDCFAADRLAASDLAEAVRRALRISLVGRTTGGATVTKVETISRPSWRPFDDTTIRRFGASYQVFFETAN
jgi:hypothetical protein